MIKTEHTPLERDLLAALLETRGVASSLEEGCCLEPGAIKAAWEMGDRAIAKARGEVER